MIVLGLVSSDLDALARDSDQASTGDIPQTSPARASRAGRAKPTFKGGRSPSKKTSGSNAPAAKPSSDTREENSGLKFARDIAPILVANCVDCHTGNRDGLRQSKLDLSSFERLMAGTPSHKVIVPGKPEESPLYLRVHGDESPVMPPGDRVLSETVVARIAAWIKSGAALDPGLDAKAPFSSYAATPEELRRLELGKQSVEERDKKCEEAGKSRFAQANPKLKPDITRGEHFLLFANLHGERARNAVKGLESQYAGLRKILGHPATEWAEKLSVYVFNDRKDLIEFIRSVETRDVDLEIQSTARMAVAQPYIAVLDPAHGGEETPHLRRKRTGRSKKVSEEAMAGAPGRTLSGLLAETFVTGAVEAAGKAPGWLSSGLGAYFAANVEPHGDHIRRLRAIAVETSRDDWGAKVADVLAENPDMKPDEVQAIGFALVTWLRSPGLSRAFPRFAAGVLKDPSNLDGLLNSIYKTNREQFLTGSGEWVAERFGNSQALPADDFSE